MGASERTARRARGLGVLALSLVAPAACQGVLGIDVGHARSVGARGACVLNSNCADVEVCLFGICSPPCAEDRDCRDGEQCLRTSDNGTACVATRRAGCDTTKDCPPGTECAGGSCLAVCTSTASCAGGQSCSGGVCVSRAGSSDAGTTGGSGGRAGTGGSSGSGGRPGSGGAGGSVETVPLPTTCAGDCCPASATCYSTAAGVDAPGAECLALQDNTGQPHIQLRQTWGRDLAPAGNTDSLIYSVLAGRTDLPMKDCYQGRSPLGSGGYIQLLDFFVSGSDHSKDYATVGYSTAVTATNLSSTLSNGFCNGAEDYAPLIDAKYALRTADITPPSPVFPPGLPGPMGAADSPWPVGPLKAERLDADFDLSGGARNGLLALFDLGNANNVTKNGFGGVFYFDEVAGYAHIYGPLSWSVVYSQDDKTHLAIPIREMELKIRFDHPAHPNCVGTYRTDVLDLASSPACGSSDPKNPVWGGGNCGDHACDPAAAEAPGTLTGYVLIRELEQLFSPDLLKTLCVSYPGNDPQNPNQSLVAAEGFYDATEQGCRSAKWAPNLADDAGIPKGDWCAATNAPATATCHDAWRVQSLRTFAAAKIVVGPANNPVVTCAF